MRLTLKTLPHYLLDKGMISPSSIISGDYISTQSQTRNVIFNVRRKSGKSLFIKQVNNPEPTSLYVLQKDATCMWLIKHESAYTNLRSYVPEYFGYDVNNQVLVTQFIDNSIDLDAYFKNGGQLNQRLIQQLAEMLKSFHFNVSTQIKNRKSAQFFPSHIPWAMDLGMIKTPDKQVGLSHTSAPNPAVQKVAQDPEHLHHLEKVHKNWEYKSLIHGDIKWLNILISDKDTNPHLHLIDWEIADIGDPLWDVAGVFQGCICNEIIYTYGYHHPAFETSNTRLKIIVPALNTLNGFIAFYDKDISDKKIKKIISYTAARLIQSATEYNISSFTLVPYADLLLKISKDIFQHLDAIVKKVKIQGNQ